MMDTNASLYGDLSQVLVTREEIAAIVTHATMYVGWPKGWAVFRLAKDIWDE